MSITKITVQLTKLRSLLKPLHKQTAEREKSTAIKNDDDASAPKLEKILI